MSVSHNLALALAAAILDATLGYPAWFALVFGSASTWIAGWLATVEGAEPPGGGAGALLFVLAPVVIGALVLGEILPRNAFGFVVSALVASAMCGRQTLDTRARNVARVWEQEGVYVALVAAEPLGPSEAETRLAPACASAIAARYADEVAAPTLFIALGGLPGVVLIRAIGVVGRICRERHDVGPFGKAVAALERWTLGPAARIGAFWLAAAAATMGSANGFAAVIQPSARPTAPAEAVMLKVLGETERDEPAYLRRALALFRRAAALEFAALVLLTLLLLVLSGHLVGAM